MTFNRLAMELDISRVLESKQESLAVTHQCPLFNKVIVKKQHLITVVKEFNKLCSFGFTQRNALQTKRKATKHLFIYF